MIPSGVVSLAHTHGVMGEIDIAIVACKVSATVREPVFDVGGSAQEIEVVDSRMLCDA